jgi:hypothetical protein
VRAVKIIVVEMYNYLPLRGTAQSIPLRTNGHRLLHMHVSNARVFDRGKH